MKPILFAFGAAVFLTLFSGCAAYRSGEWPRLNYDDPGRPEVETGDAVAAPQRPDRPASVPAPISLSELGSEFTDIERRAEAQIIRLEGLAAELEEGSEEVRRRGWLSLQLELSRLNRLRADLAELIGQGDNMGHGGAAAEAELSALLEQMRRTQAQLTAAAKATEQRLETEPATNEGQ